jgi:hypothetical protein
MEGRLEAHFRVYVGESWLQPPLGFPRWLCDAQREEFCDLRK